MNSCVSMPRTVLLFAFTSLLHLSLSTTTRAKGQYDENQLNFPFMKNENQETNLSNFKSFSMNLREKRIKFGLDANIEDFPSAVSIIHGSMVKCGGSRITEQHVLTAAHCSLEPIDQIFVLLNATYLPPFLSNVEFICEQIPRNLEGEIREISGVKIHEEYNRCQLYINDIAILVVRDFHLVKYSGNSLAVKPNLAKQVFNHCIIPGETKLIMPGFEINARNKRDGRLKKIEMKATNDNKCLAAMGTSFIPGMHTCAMTVSGEPSEGDTGSPVFIKRPDSAKLIQMGIMSERVFDSTIGCGRQLEKIYVITNIKAHQEWIIKRTHEDHESLFRRMLKYDCD